MIYKYILKLDKEFIFDFITLIFGITAIYFIVWSFTGQWPWSTNYYNSFALQADAWRSGNLDLGRDYSFLELAIYNGKYYVSFPPFPSFLIFPFTVFFGSKTPDHFIALFSSWLGAFYALRLLRRFHKKDHLFWILFLMVGSNLLYVSVNGWVWFLAQNMAFTLSIMALYYAVAGKGGLSMACWAFSVGCRPFQVIYAPVLLYILYKQMEPAYKMTDIIKRYFLWAVPTMLIASVYMALNYARFGSIIEFGHNYLPEFTDAEHGQFSSIYLKENFKRLFRLPKLGQDGVLDFHKFDGVAFWLVNPIVISYLIYYVSRCTRKYVDKVLLIVIPVLIALHLFLICLHKTLGGWHFGNRYTIDFLPFMFYSLLCLTSYKNDWLMRFQYPIFIFGLALNVAGTIHSYTV